MKPKVSILICHKNGEQIIENCLSSLKKTDYPNFEICVLLNGTNDKSEYFIKRHKTKIFKSPKNLGFAGGCNYLINRTASKYVVFLNNDTEVKPNWLNKLVDYAEKNDIAACQPKILDLKNKKEFEYAGASGYYLDKYCYPFVRGRLFDSIEQNIGQYNTPIRIFYASGVCMLVRRDILHETGLLDEDFYMYFEETDLCWRINLLGEKIYCVPSSVVYHFGSFTVKQQKMTAEKEYLLHRNGLLTFFKNYDKKTIKRLIIPKLLLEITSGIVFPKKFVPVFKSFCWLIKNRKLIKQKNIETQRLRKIDDKEIQKIMLKKSIVWLYFIKGKRTFNEIEKYF
jgi:GT2 family glycosyltransferase